MAILYTKLNRKKEELYKEKIPSKADPTDNVRQNS